MKSGFGLLTNRTFVRIMSIEVRVMDGLGKLQLLGAAAQVEAAEDVGLFGQRVTTSHAPPELRQCISHATLPGGQRVPMLKTLVSSVCENDCKYCAFRAGRDTRRATFTPDELARLSDQLWRKGLVKGIFLSSGVVGGGPRTQDTIIATAEILRRKYRFPGFLHVKIMPGAERDQVAETLRWADRVSLNLEAPNAERIRALSSTKDFRRELVAPLMTADRLRRALNPRVSLTTQFVVGAAQESDQELLRTSSWLYRHLSLARAYYSAFQPVPDTPLEGHAYTPAWREHRLYQSDFLFRQYGFSLDELVFDEEGHLPQEADPKALWADAHPEFFPVEVNRASRQALLRVPGLGPRSVSRILQERTQAPMRTLRALRGTGAVAARAAPFVLLDGRRPDYQLRLW